MSLSKISVRYTCSFLSAFFLILSPIYANCLTPIQNQTIYDLANSTNISGKTLETIFIAMCEKYDSANESLDLLSNYTISNFSAIDLRVQNMSNNLTQYALKKDMNQSVADLNAKIDYEFNRSFNETVLTHMFEFESKMRELEDGFYENISDMTLKAEDRFSEKISSLRRDFVERIEFEEKIIGFENNITGHFDIMINKYVKVPPYITYGFWIAVMIFGLTVVYLVSKKKLSKPKRIISDSEGEPQTTEGLVTSSIVEERRKHLKALFDTFFKHKDLKKLSKNNQRVIVKKIQDGEIIDKKDLDEGIGLSLKLQGLEK